MIAIGSPGPLPEIDGRRPATRELQARRGDSFRQARTRKESQMLRWAHAQGTLLQKPQRKGVTVHRTDDGQTARTKETVDLSEKRSDIPHPTAKYPASRDVSVRSET